MTHSRDTCESASCTVCYPQPFSSKPLARRSGQAPRHVTGPGGDNPITDAQIVSVINECGYPPDASSVRCPTCDYGPGWQCRASNGMERKPHAARKHSADVAYRSYADRCAAVYNARHAGKEGR